MPSPSLDWKPGPAKGVTKLVAELSCRGCLMNSMTQYCEYIGLNVWLSWDARDLWAAGWVFLAERPSQVNGTELLTGLAVGLSSQRYF